LIKDLNKSTNILISKVKPKREDRYSIDNFDHVDIEKQLEKVDNQVSIKKKVSIFPKSSIPDNLQEKINEINTVKRFL
jgi:hypothetical protein